MKTNQFTKLFLFVLAVASVAQADFRPGRVRPVQRTTFLNEVNEMGDTLRSHVGSLTGLQMDGARNLVGFDLSVQRVVMCFRAPCPTILRNSHFDVVNVQRITSRETQYTAIERGPLGAAFLGSQIVVTEDSATGDLSILETSRRNPNQVLNRFDGQFQYLMVTM